MEHHMNLHEAPFRMIRSGRKIYELRLYDEKRRKIHVGDTILFTCGAEQLTAEVAGMHVFASFAELYDTLPLLQCGYTPEDIHTASPADMEQYYSKDQQERYKVVAIELCGVHQ